MENDSLRIGTKVVTEIKTEGIDKWLCVLIIIGVSVLVLSILLIIHQKSQRMKRKEKLKKGSKIDMNNVINSSFMAKPLYDELKGKCHPDNFSTNPEIHEKATEIFSLLVANKYNYNNLLALKKRAEQELKIKIN